MPSPSQPIRSLSSSEELKFQNPPPETKESGVDTGISSIKKSKMVIPPQLLDFNLPILIPPLNQLSGIELKDLSSKIKKNFLMEITGQINEIKHQILGAWAENLKQLREDFENYLKSPLYQQMMAIHKKEAQGLTPSGAPMVNTELGMATVLNHVRMIEQISPTDSEIKAKSYSNSTFNQLLPFSISMVVGGGLALSPASISEGIANPLVGSVNFIQQLQPLLPLQVTAQNIIPFINLMVAAPIYYHSWNEAVKGIFNREGQANQATAQKFAEEMIKMISNPTFNLLGLIKGTPQIEGLSSDQKQNLSSMLKFILAGVALSLLYATEVGKASGKEFGGMTAEELRDLLNGKIAPQIGEGKLTHSEQLTMTLIKQARAQLEQLASEERVLATNLLLDYVEKSRTFNRMTEPEKVLSEALRREDFHASSQFENVKG